MKRALQSPSRLLHKTWRAGHPFPRRLSGGRRWGIGLLFVLLTLVITFYSWITHAAHVREMAESYLSQLVGGQVHVGRATLSIFQGLKLEDVRLYVKSPSPEDRTPLFEAQAVQLDYNPAALLEGRVDARRIIATGPRVVLTEDLRTGRWSHEDLKFRARSRKPRDANDQGPLVLPEVVLRDAQVEYRQFDGKTLHDIGIFTMEGQLKPLAETDTYRFNLQTRGKSEGAGPSVDGTAVPGEVHASISNFVFDSDIKAMLPEPIRLWCEAHHLSGTLDVPELTCRYETTTPSFRAKIALHDVTMQVSPEEWLGKHEMQRRAWTRDALGILGAADGAPGEFWSPDRVTRISDSMVPWPITLQNAQGDFIFTESGIDLAIREAKVEDNSFKITGHVDGYAASAAAHIQIATLDNADLVIPPSPRYVSALPAPVREIYDRFQPQGHIRLQFDLLRREAGGNILSNGQIDVLSGQGVFENFRYPVRLTGGRLLVRADPTTGGQTLIVSHITGHGIAGGPNADADLDVSGWMGPLGPEAQVQIVVSGTGLHGEPALYKALPHGTQKALTFFDEPGHGQFPTFAGAFQTNVVREPGRVSHWHIQTDIHVTDAAGIPTFFPYAMEHASGDLLFAGDHVTIKDGLVHHGDSEFTVNGGVDWGPRKGAANSIGTNRNVDSGIRPDLIVKAKGLPIDDALIAALPRDQRSVLAGLGMSGALDISGHIGAAPVPAAAPPGKPAPSPVTLDLDLVMHDGAAHPNGTPALTDLNGSMVLTEQSLTVNDLHGHRGPADVSAHGTFDWSAGPTVADLETSAQNLALDADLYQLLPAPAQKAWDSVKPSGRANVDLNYQGPITGLALTGPTTAPSMAPSAVPATGPAAAGQVMASASPAAAIGDAADSAGAMPAVAAVAQPVHYTMTLLPQKASAQPQSAPYHLDDLTGKVVVRDGNVWLDGVSAHHGRATVAINGTGTPAGVWDLALNVANAPVDADLLAAVPPPVADLLTTTKFSGEMSVDIKKLHLAPSSVDPTTNPAVAAAPPAVAAPATSGAPADRPIDCDFDLSMHTDAASLDVGVPLENANATVALAGSVLAGKLQNLSGGIDMASARLASRPISKLKCTIEKSAAQEIVRLGNMQALLAGGEMAGEVDFQLPGAGPSRYALALVLRDADVKQLTGEAANVNGRLAVSLSLQGDCDNPYTRQGRGDLTVTGQQMYRMPLVLGLLEVTSMSLPISSPFTDGAARYSVEGMKVDFDNIELKSKDMLMQGNGDITYDTHQVRMTFFVDSTTWPKIPVVGDLIQGARRDLLQIHVKGTLQDPKVSAGVANTFTTTIDEVFRSGSTTQPETDKASAKQKRYGY